MIYVCLPVTILSVLVGLNTFFPECRSVSNIADTVTQVSNNELDRPCYAQVSVSTVGRLALMNLTPPGETSLTNAVVTTALVKDVKF